MQVSIIGAAELEALLGLYEHLHEGEEPPSELAAARKVWDEALANLRIRYFGGYEQGQLVASCTVTVIPNLTRSCKPYAVIENVVTHREHRNKGWGRAVLKAATDFAWSSGCYKIMLMTGRKEESVFRFY